MSGDYSRFTYDTLRDYDRVRPQQGRVLADADLNELSDAFDHRLRALALDVLGPCTAPVDQAAGPGATADGFKIEPGGASFTIGLGRLYLHGLQLDNHGSVPYLIEPGLQDRRGQSAIAYEAQPYYPNPPAAPKSGEYVVYVDAWEREVTAVSDPQLVDPAITVDTAARMQTVWQVKVLADVGDAVTCATDLPEWDDLTAPSAAQLTVAAVGVPAPTDPCSVPADGGYRGWENRLYRVEVHTAGPLGTATFKWSRDNASVETAVTDTDTTRTILTVARTGRDDVQRIRAGAWVEVLDDEHELGGTPGYLAQVVLVDSVDDMTQTVTLSGAVPAEFAPLGADRRTRLRQWDHSTATSTINTADTTGGYVLEDGVQITFSATSATGAFRTGDFWTFAARSADASLQSLDHAAPQGPVHFYGRLAVVGGKTTQDCRTIWPAQCEGDCGGECTECVTPESHASGQLTIQMAVDHVRVRGGTVCLAAGRYALEEPVVIERAHALTIRGHRWASLLEYGGAGPAILVFESVGVQLLDLTVLIGAEVEPASNPADIASEPSPTMKNDVRSARISWSDTNADQQVNEIKTRNSRAAYTPLAGIGLVHAGGVRIEGCVVLDVRLFEAVGALAGGVLGSTSTQHESPLAAQYKSGYGQTAGIVTAGIVVGLAVRDCILVAAVGVCAWHSLAASLRFSKTHIPAVAALATEYSLLAGADFADDIVIGLRNGVWWDEAVLTTQASFLRCMIRGLLAFGFEWDAHSLDSHSSIRSCIVGGRWVAIDTSASGLAIADCTLTASGTGATGAEAQRELTNGDAVQLTAPAVEGTLAEVVVRNCAITAARYGVAASSASRGVSVVGNVLSAGLGGVVLLPDASGQRWVVGGNDVQVTGLGVPRAGNAMLAGIWLVQATLSEVRENYVHAIGSSTQQPLSRMGIAVEQCDSVVVARNTIADAIGGGRPSVSIGIGCWPDAGRLDLIDNVVCIDCSASVPAAADLAAFIPIRIDGSSAKTFRDVKTDTFAADTVVTDRLTKRSVQQETKQSFTNVVPGYLAKLPSQYLKFTDRFVRLTPWSVAVVAPDVAAVAVRGNRVDTNGLRPAVFVLVDGALVLSDNVIRHAGIEDEQIVPVAVIAGADSMVVNGNHVDVPIQSATEGTARRAMLLDVADDRVAVTGNVVRGEIFVGSNVLPAPWSSMNVSLL